jgi:hypothetical protein
MCDLNMKPFVAEEETSHYFNTFFAQEVIIPVLSQKLFNDYRKVWIDYGNIRSSFSLSLQ